MKTITEGLQLGRENIGKDVRFFKDRQLFREEGIARITNVIIAPSNNEPRKTIWLNSLGNKHDYDFALKQVIEYYRNDEKAMDLRLFYVTDFMTDDLYLMLLDGEFEYLN